jgi:FAD synthetase
MVAIPNKKVMIFGTFDILHCGHLHMFKQAREYGDELVAVVGRDSNVEQVKGIGPMHTENERLDLISQIKLIDKAVLGDKFDVYKVIKQEKPNIIALGYDQRAYVDDLADAISDAGLETQIVRLSEYQEKRLKSSKIKKYIEKMV